jgi:exodeoxyribonuclease VII large subunit
MFDEQAVTVSEFVAALNQTFETMCPIINIIGELANFRVSKNKWVYFDLKDEYSSLKFFGSVFQLIGPLEDGMMLKVTSSPHLHNNYGFSMQIHNIELVGEGTLKRAAELLQIKLTKEGIFDMDRKRELPYPPSKIALVASGQSAAYHDFVKIINNRWRGLEISFIDVQVQGEIAPSQIVQAINYFNVHSDNIDVLVLTRGGGSPEDLAAFNTEEVTRAVAASKIPTLVAIGHEIDISLAELAADKRASTPSHAAEVLVPDIRVIEANIKNSRNYLNVRTKEYIGLVSQELKQQTKDLSKLTNDLLADFTKAITHRKEILRAYNPEAILDRGYSVVRKNGKVIRSSALLKINDILDISLAKGSVSSQVKGVKL